jgi:hypothetical protein
MPAPLGTWSRHSQVSQKALGKPGAQPVAAVDVCRTLRGNRLDGRQDILANHERSNARLQLTWLS